LKVKDQFTDQHRKITRDSAIAFYRKIGFTVVQGNRLWGVPMELSAAKAAEQFKNVIYKM
jgi:hypothetical protein